MLDPHKLAHDCIVDAPAPCSAACPIGVDVRDVMERIRIGSYSAAYKAFSKSAVFPGIVAHICPQYCADSCPRGEADEAVLLPELERFLWRESLKETKKQFFIPDKKKRILVVGAGITGMAIASKLAQRGYHITLAEKTGRPGGALWGLVDGGKLPPEALEEAVETLEDHKYIDVRLNTEIQDADGGYSATLVCVGPDGVFKAPDNGLDIFYMGGARDPGLDFIACIREANEMFHIIENFIKVGRRQPLETRMQPVMFRPDMTNVQPCHTAISGDTLYIDAGEAQAEAERCMGCTCSNCVDSCEMLKYFKKNPKKTIMDLSDTINKTPIVQKTALRQVMSCTQCGRCSEVCPAGIDFKSVCLESREVLHGLGHLPDSLYEYWTRDMEFSNAGEASVLIAPENPADTRYVLFPGCQIGASDPEYVSAAYGWLREADPDKSALLLGCCGAPAYWAGDRELHGGALALIRDTWEELNRPAFIMPCPTCVEMFSLHLPEVSATSLWEFMAERLEKTPAGPRGAVSVFDPCSSKYSPAMQEAVRAILTKLGYELIELPRSPEQSECCGHGGLIYTTNRELREKLRRDGAGAGDNPYVTYCVNCRDSFAGDGKEVIHILDALFFEDAGRFRRTPPSLTLRRDNRRRLKSRLLKEYRGMDVSTPKPDITLEVSPQLRKTMDERLILDDNAVRVILSAENGGRMVLDPATGYYTAHAVEGRLTFWVVYEPVVEGAYRLHDAYAHRMVIEE